jgi:hypothetical protein
VFGSLCVQARDDKKAKKREEAVRVATAFQTSYEKNKGVVLAKKLHFQI